MNTLYLIPTPIGNLEDMTLRGLRLLKEVDLIAAEDTRNSFKLLQHFEIQTPMLSYHEHNKLARLNQIMDALAIGDVALISDAGTPGISDPGYELVQEAIRQGVKVVPLPGANALLPALIASGLPTDAFAFYGFPPRKYEALRSFLASIEGLRETLVFYESPKRLVETLIAVEEVLGNRPAAVAREISKYYEEILRLPVQDLIQHFTDTPARGEIVLVIGGQPLASAETWSEAQVRAAMQALLDEGHKRSEAAKMVAEQSGWDRRELYALKL